MPRKKYKAEEIVSKPRQVDVLVAQGNKVPDFVSSMSDVSFTFPNAAPVWRSDRIARREHARHS